MTHVLFSGFAASCGLPEELFKLYEKFSNLGFCLVQVRIVVVFHSKYLQPLIQSAPACNTVPCIHALALKVTCLVFQWWQVCLQYYKNNVLRLGWCVHWTNLLLPCNFILKVMLSFQNLSWFHDQTPFYRSARDNFSSVVSKCQGTWVTVTIK